MSYPRIIQTLIVEDEDDQIRSYELLFNRLTKDESCGVERPTFALSYEDAERCLSEPNIYHMVILDMGLPPSNRKDTPDGVEHGMQLLDLIARRDEYPVPVVLVISGRLGGSTWK